MTPTPGPSLQPLRVPTGWLVEWNVFFEVDSTLESGNENEIEPSEDVLQISHKKNSVLIDLGWRPDGAPAGEYRLLALRMYANDDEMRSSWDKPLRALVSRSRIEIVRTLEEWLWHFAHHKK